MDVKVICPCGAKYQFPVEPVDGLLPCSIACPVCGLDNTELGNDALAEKLMNAAVPVTTAPAGLRINVRPTTVAELPPAPRPFSATPLSAARAAPKSSMQRLRKIGASLVTIVLVCVGVYALYAKWSKRVGGVSNLVSAFSGSDEEDSGPQIRWVLPIDDGGALLVRGADHTNVAQAFIAVYGEVMNQKMTAAPATTEYDEDSKFAVYPAYKGSVEILGSQDWPEPRASALATALSKKLSTMVVVALMGDDADSGVVALYENGERKFRLKRWYQITSLSEDGLKEFMEREGEAWATQQGYVPGPEKVLTGDTDQAPFEDVNNFLLKLGFDTSDAEEIKNVLLLK